MSIKHLREITPSRKKFRRNITFSACKTVSLVAFLALLSAAPAFTQSPSDEATPEAKAVAPPVAHVYVQTRHGVDVFDAAADGKLTLVKDSPFATVGQMGGINGKYLIAVGTTNLRTYPIASNGAVGRQVSITNTADFPSSECGVTGSEPAYLDHTGLI